MMNQAIKLAEIDYGPQSDWDYEVNNTQDSDGNIEYNKGNEIDKSVQKYFAPYLKIISFEDFTNVAYSLSPQRIYYLADGSAFSYNLHENREIYFYPKNPKKCLLNTDARGSCAFMFSFMSSRYVDIADGKYNIANGMQPCLVYWDGNDNSLMSSGTHGCKNGNGTYCTEIIRRNGWKIPKDYPRKF